jgi:protein tyrosine/serine phosphatase
MRGSKVVLSEPPALPPAHGLAVDESAPSSALDAHSPGCDQPPRGFPAEGRGSVGGHPELELREVANFRDAAHANPAIRRRMIYRSAPPYSQSAADVATLVTDLRVRTVVDLRSEAEKRVTRAVELRSPLHAATSGVRVLAHPLISQPRKLFRVLQELPVADAVLLALRAPAALVLDSARERVMHAIIPVLNDLGLNGYYQGILEDTQSQLLGVLKLYLEPANYPILLHCTGGKDRTGVVLALLAHLAGSPMGDVEEDFNLSEEWLEEIREANALVTAGLYGEHMHRAPKASIRALFRFVEGRYGSVEEYLCSIGFGHSMQRQVRSLLAIAPPQPQSRL